MVAEVFAGISGFKAMLDIAKSFKDMNDTAARQGIAIELREQILSAQETQATLVEQIRELKEQIVSFETWDHEKEKYELKSIARGAFAYAPKKGVETTEPMHWLCANCFQCRKKALLQYLSSPEITKSIWVCHACKAQIKVPHSVHPGNENESS